MKREDMLLIQSPQTKFKEIEFIRKDTLLDWAKRQMSFEQGFKSGEAERGYRFALEDLTEYLSRMEE